MPAMQFNNKNNNKKHFKTTNKQGNEVANNRAGNGNTNKVPIRFKPTNATGNGSSSGSSKNLNAGKFASEPMKHLRMCVGKTLQRRDKDGRMMFSADQQHNVYKNISQYIPQFETLLNHYYKPDAEKFKYPKIMFKCQANKNYPIPAVNIQCVIAVDGDINLHKYVIPSSNEIGPLRIIYAYEKETMDSTRKEENKTDKYCHFIKLGDDENNYTSYYKCMCVGEDGQKFEAPWHMLETRASSCSFEIVNYDEEARTEDKLKIRDSQIERHYGKITANDCEYLKQTYIRTYAYVQHRLIWEFYKKNTIFDNDQIKNCIGAIVNILDHCDTCFEDIAYSIKDTYDSSNRFEVNFFQNVIVNTINQKVENHIKTAKKYPEGKIFELLEYVNDIVYVVQRNLKEKTNSSEISIDMDKAKMVKMQKALEEQSKDYVVDTIVYNPYDASISYKHPLKKIIGLMTFENLMQKYRECVLTVNQQPEQLFIERCGHENIGILNELNKIITKYSKVIQEIRTALQKGTFDQRIEGELEFIQTLCKPLKLMEAIMMRRHVTSNGQLVTDRAIRLFSYDVIYSLQVRLLYLKSDCDLANVDATTIDCETSYDNPAALSSYYLPMIRDFESIFAKVSKEYNTNGKVRFPELSQQERESIKKFVLGYVDSLAKNDK